MDRSHQDSGITDIYISQILDVYPDLNPSWLLTGKGPMILEPDAMNIVAEPVVSYRKSKDGVKREQLIPLYSLEASAGIVKLFSDSTKFQPIDFLRIPNLPKSDGAVYVTGDSMYPLLKSGDIVVYKQFPPVIESIFFGEMYIVSVNLNGDELTTVKWIQKSESGGDYVKLVSQNAHHQPKDIHISKILAIALVKASVRINSMS